MAYNFPNAPNDGDVFSPDDGPSWKFGDGAWLQTQFTNTKNYIPPPLAAGIVSPTQTMEVIGAVFGDFVETSFSANLSGVILSAWVSAPDTVQFRFVNPTGGLSVNLPAGTVTCRLRKR